MVPWHTGQRRLGFLAAADPAAGGQDRGLDPDDPWAIKVADILSPEDAAAALADLEVQRKGGHIDPGKAAAVSAAIEARSASLDGQAAA